MKCKQDNALTALELMIKLGIISLLFQLLKPAVYMTAHRLHEHNATAISLSSRLCTKFVLSHRLICLSAVGLMTGWAMRVVDLTAISRGEVLNCLRTS